MATELEETAVCTRCGRERRMKFLKPFKNRSGKTVMRCRARSVCASKGRRRRAAAAK